MNRLDRLTPLLRHFTDIGPAGCALQVAQRGRTIYENHVGLADLEEQRPIGPDTIYRIYSMSKVITCTAALMLYERGLFALNDPLSEYLPEFKDPQVYRYTATGSLYASPAARPIRVKDLFLMASGYPYTGGDTATGRDLMKVFDLNTVASPGKGWSLRDFAKVLGKTPLAFDPGTHWMYGFSHDILGALIEALSGKSFGAFLKDEIFDPLGMADTSFRIGEGKLHRLCSLYDRADDGKLTKNLRLDDVYAPDAAYESGGAGMLSTLHDYGRFAQALAAGELEGVRLLGRHTVGLMAANHLSPQQMADYNWEQLAGYGYGLGVRVMVDQAAGGSAGNPGEFGWAGYAGTLVYMDPKEELSIVYMQQMIPNQEPYHLPRIRDVVYGAL